MDTLKHNPTGEGAVTNRQISSFNQTISRHRASSLNLRSSMMYVDSAPHLVGRREGRPLYFIRTQPTSKSDGVENERREGIALTQTARVCPGISCLF